jgi:hypothetical protein
MPIAGCSSPSDVKTQPASSCDDPTQPCPRAERLTNLTVIEGASVDGVVGPNRWATARHPTNKVVIEATTEPNTAAVWSRLQWSGDAGEAVPGAPNRRQLPRAASIVLRPAVALAGDQKSIEIWVVAATIEIRSSGTAPANAAQFQSLFGPPSQALGPVTSEGMTGHVYPGDRYIQNMHTRGKIVAIATLTPTGVHDVVTSGWTFRRERFTKNWVDGRPAEQMTTDWTDDTSKPDFLRLTPDAADKIYDTDGPDIRWGDRSYEIYHSFRERVEWHSDRCSDYGPWHFHAAWRANVDQSRQILFNRVGPGNPQLPTKPALP